MTEAHLKLYPPPVETEAPPPGPPSAGFRVAAIVTGTTLGLAALLIDWFVGKLLG